MHNKNKMQNNRQNPTTEEITYRISGKGKSWSYKYGKLHPGCYTDQIPQVDQIPQKDQSPQMNIIVLTRLFHREDLRIMDMCIILQIIMSISPRRISVLTRMLILTPLM